MPITKTGNKKSVIISLAVLTGIAVFGLCGVVQAGVKVTSDYTLTSDMYCEGDCLIVSADGITIDGNGHAITGNGSGNGIANYYMDGGGIRQTAHNNFTIRNVTITGFHNGISFFLSTGSTIQNVTASSNTYGIYLKSSNSNTLINNITDSNSGSAYASGGNQIHSSGIYLSSSSDNYLGLDNRPDTGNTANHNNNTGIFIEGGSGNHLNYNTTDLNGVWGILTMYSNAGRPDSNVFFGNNANSNGSYGIQTDWGIRDTIINNTANSNGLDGIYLYNSSATTIKNNTVKNNLYTGIRVRHRADNNTVTGNAIESNPYGIYLSENSSNTLTNNIINSNTSDGIHLDSSSSNTIANNTFYGTLPQFALAQINNSTGALFKNNIVYNGKYVSVGNGSQTDSEYNYNDYYGGSGNYFNWIGTDYRTFADWKTNSGQDADSLNSDPEFVNAGTDFHLQSSPCIDAGVEVGLTKDYEGTSRPQGSAPDIGAYELIVAPPSPEEGKT